MQTTKSILTTITETIIELLEKVSNGDIETWLPQCGLARNPVTKHCYTSINQLLLSHALYKKNYAHNLWLTYKQTVAAGGFIINGEKATQITLTEFIYFINGKKATQNEAKSYFADLKEKDPTITNYKEAGITSKRFLKYYFVFNIGQTSGLSDEFYQVSPTSEEPMVAVRSIIDSNEIKVVNVVANEAFYDPNLDKIQMPFLQQFKSNEHYCSVLLHECIHWSGNEKRLNRTFDTFGTEHYAFEELIAELGSTFLCAQLGIPSLLTSSSAYIKSWLNVLHNDNTYIFKAMHYAEKAMEYLLQPKTESVQFYNH